MPVYVLSRLTRYGLKCYHRRAKGQTDSSYFIGTVFWLDRHCFRLDHILNRHLPTALRSRHCAGVHHSEYATRWSQGKQRTTTQCDTVRQSSAKQLGRFDGVARAREDGAARARGVGRCHKRTVQNYRNTKPEENVYCWRIYVDIAEASDCRSLWLWKPLADCIAHVISRKCYLFVSRR